MTPEEGQVAGVSWSPEQQLAELRPFEPSRLAAQAELEKKGNGGCGLAEDHLDARRDRTY